MSLCVALKGLKKNIIIWLDTLNDKDWDKTILKKIKKLKKGKEKKKEWDKR